MPEQLLDWKGIWEEYMDWRNKAERHIGTLLPSHEAALVIERIVEKQITELIQKTARLIEQQRLGLARRKNG